MAVVCYVNHGVEPPTRPLSSRAKRPHSETEGNETDDEETVLFSRHCQAVWSGIFNSYPKLFKLQRTTDPHLNAFLLLFNETKIQQFLWIDSCCRIADRYLLAMVYVYFKRANLSLDQYNVFNFFTALYLANDMEEDDEDEKYEIFPWTLGKSWMKSYPMILCQRDKLWRKMGFRAVVSKKTCEEVIAMVPEHSVWSRQRQRHHGGALRNYMKPGTPRYGRTSPAYCETCLSLTEGRDSPRKTSRQVSMKNMDFLDEIDFEYRQTYYRSLSDYSDSSSSSLSLCSSSPSSSSSYTNLPLSSNHHQCDPRLRREE